ncbi:MAG: DUF4339 domain-containing protein [Pirellulaceae bacterium]
MATIVELTRGTNGKMATEWYYQIMNDVVGPLSGRQLLDKVSTGQVKEDTLVRKDDSQWVPARQVNGLLDAALQPQAQRICPYCGQTVDPPPSTCRGCNRKLVLSFSSRLTTIGKDKTKVKKIARDKEVEVEALREHSDRSEIVRYGMLLALWLGLLVAAPYLIYLATTGKLFFSGDLAIISFVAVSAVVGGIYYWISRLG